MAHRTTTLPSHPPFPTTPHHTTNLPYTIPPAYPTRPHPIPSHYTCTPPPPYPAPSHHTTTLPYQSPPLQHHPTLPPPYPSPSHHTTPVPCHLRASCLVPTLVASRQCRMKS
ncbi:hypothetical protein Pmani_003064 [Petrolisthes manimaculis]|uniref:Uncharacterized protein n=1 Tax=Petrolisthes manimaculis TaxID=1843537 RepID=A0AAE1QHB2_9EUCA|nr:hypothetical protein Pmani_003064 [Petrolisthes manimaculis]